MENFTAFNPTVLHFGKNVLDKLPAHLNGKGKNALLITGKGSAKKYGYYDKVVEKLQKTGKNIIDFQGIKPNPIVDDAEKAVELARKHHIDFIVALGGGSVVDTAKIVNMAYANRLPVWDIMKRRVEPVKKVPLFVILTLAATGSEMNGAAVLQNHHTQEKIGYFSPLMYPDVSFLDPTFTFTVPRNQTVNGIIDLIAHSLEAFFSGGSSPLSDRFVAANILEAFDYTPPLLNDLTNYDLRARMMWSATVAENGTTIHGRTTSGDWGTHALAHHISLLWDTPHGQTLSVIFPAWMKANFYKISPRLKDLGALLTGNSQIKPEETISIFEDFFTRIGAPVRFEQLGLTGEDKKRLLNLWHKNKPTGINIILDENDYQNIISYL